MTPTKLTYRRFILTWPLVYNSYLFIFVIREDAGIGHRFLSYINKDSRTTLTNQKKGEWNPTSWFDDKGKIIAN